MQAAHQEEDGCPASMRPLRKRRPRRRLLNVSSRSRVGRCRTLPFLAAVSEWSPGASNILERTCGNACSAACFAVWARLLQGLAADLKRIRYFLRYLACTAWLLVGDKPATSRVTMILERAHVTLCFWYSINALTSHSQCNTNEGQGARSNQPRQAQPLLHAQAPKQKSYAATLAPAQAAARRMRQLAATRLHHACPETLASRGPHSR